MPDIANPDIQQMLDTQTRLLMQFLNLPEDLHFDITVAELEKDAKAVVSWCASFPADSKGALSVRSPSCAKIPRHGGLNSEKKKVPRKSVMSAQESARKAAEATVRYKKGFKSGLTKMDKVLAFVNRHKEVNSRDVAKLLGSSTTNACKTLEVLLKQKKVTRKKVKKGYRNIHVQYCYRGVK